MSWKRLVLALVYTAIVILFVGSLLGILLTGPVVVRFPSLVLDVKPSPERLRETVELLCTDLAPRDYTRTDNLDRAGDWIASRMREAGLEVTYQTYTLPEGRYRNVIGLLQGEDPAGGATVIGAHYDAVEGSPGADDNASGVAVLLELARTLPQAPPRRPLYLVAFSTEEPPFFRSEGMGSHVFAKSLRDEGVEVELMVALDLVGYYRDEPGSQRFPIPLLGLLYPDRGDFVAVVGDLRSGRWIRPVKERMLGAGSIPVHSFRAPAWVPGVDWSDHLSFRKLGMPGVLITDTAFLRYPHYHTALDTPEKLDYERMAGLVRALHGLLAGEFLSGNAGSPPDETGQPESR